MYSPRDCTSLEINVGFSFINIFPSSWISHCCVLHLQFSAADLDKSLFQPFPSEVVFQNYLPCEVYEVPLILRNKDKVSAGTWRFNTMVEEESSGIHTLYNIVSYLLQHSTSRIKCLTSFILQGGRNLPVLQILPMILVMHWWYLTQRNFLGSMLPFESPWLMGMLTAV